MKITSATIVTPLGVARVVEDWRSYYSGSALWRLFKSKPWIGTLDATIITSSELEPCTLWPTEFSRGSIVMLRRANTTQGFHGVFYDISRREFLSVLVSIGGENFTAAYGSSGQNRRSLRALWAAVDDHISKYPHLTRD